MLDVRNNLNRDVLDVDLPRHAVDRSLQALGHILVGVQGWEEFVLVYRILEPAVLELQAFISWCNDVRSYPQQRLSQYSDGKTLTSSLPLLTWASPSSSSTRPVNPPTSSFLGAQSINHLA